MNPIAAKSLLLTFLFAAAPSISPAPATGAPIPMIHATDLFRPHEDPDDHWDLACVFALAQRRDVDLKAVLIDYPQPTHPERNPDIAAVAQLNYLTGLGVPVAVGSPHPMQSRRDAQPRASQADHQGIDLVLQILRESDRPVVINVIGSCRDIAVAGNKAPELFKQKCAGVYLNAGTGSPDPTRSRRLEYNVSQAPLSYAAIFDLPCPVYWMPCFEELGTDDARSVRAYGTHYAFRQGELLPHLSTRMQNYFIYMLSRQCDHQWLRCLSRPPETSSLETFSGQTRHMWCTGGFLHAAGKSVTAQGALPDLASPVQDAVWSFDPIEVTCADDGTTRWRPAEASRDRFIFHVRDLDHYAGAMTQAMKTLLQALP